MSFVLICMGFVLAALAVLIFYGGRRVSKVRGEPGGAPVLTRYPQAALLTPVTGAPEGMEECLLALARQTYPNYELVFITEDEQDPATPVLDRVIDAVRKDGAGVVARRVVAGKAQNCGQKNHNLLAGVRSLSPDVEVLAFCDSTHLPKKDWLQHLLAPIADRRARVSTGYHHCFLKKPGFPAMGKSLTVLALYLMQEIPLITQPWGGSMACDKNLFDELDIQSLWAKTVVDDVTLAGELAKRRIRCEAVAESVMRTELGEESPRSWFVWLVRQWFYLKFIFPGSWIGIGVALYTLFFLIVGSALAVPLGLVGAVPMSNALCGLLFLTAVGIMGVCARRNHPAPCGHKLWLLGYYGMLLTAGVAHVWTVPMRKLRWRHISYDVGAGGAVRKVYRTPVRY